MDVGQTPTPASEIEGRALFSSVGKGEKELLIGRVWGLVVPACVFECGNGDTVSGNRRRPAGFDGQSYPSEQG